MPQDKTMSAEKFCSYVWDGENGYSDCDEFISACKKRDAQLIRSTLEAAAERVKAKRITVTAATWNDALDEAEADIIEPIAQKVEI